MLHYAVAFLVAAIIANFLIGRTSHSLSSPPSLVQRHG
jgi:hypothetical protein